MSRNKSGPVQRGVFWAERVKSQRPKGRRKHGILEKLKIKHGCVWVLGRLILYPPTLEPTEKLTQKTEGSQSITFIAGKTGSKNTRWSRSELYYLL